MKFDDILSSESCETGSFINLTTKNVDFETFQEYLKNNDPIFRLTRLAPSIVFIFL